MCICLHHVPTSVLKVQVEAEAVAVKRVAEQSCPLEIELERVVLTPTGVLLGCWQVLLLSLSRPSPFICIYILVLKNFTGISYRVLVARSIHSEAVVHT